MNKQGLRDKAVLRDGDNFHAGSSWKAFLLRWHLMDGKEGFRWVCKGKKILDRGISKFKGR